MLSWQEIERNQGDNNLAVWSASSSATGFGLVNLRDKNRGTYWKGANATGPTTVTLDLGTTVLNVTGMGIARHNAVAAGWSGAVVEASTNNFSTIGFTYTIGSDFGFDVDDRAYIFGSISNYRYWRLRIPTHTAAPEIGEIVFGRVFQYLNIDSGRYEYEAIFPTRSERLENGGTVVEEFGRLRHRFVLRRTRLPESDALDFMPSDRAQGVDSTLGVQPYLTTLGISRGSLFPTFYIPPDDNELKTSFLAYYGRWLPPYKVTEYNLRQYDFDLVFEEEA